jgi:hypothetical protein
MVTSSFVTPFRKATFCCAPSCASDKLGCAAGGRKKKAEELRNRVWQGMVGQGRAGQDRVEWGIKHKTDLNSSQ